MAMTSWTKQSQELGLKLSFVLEDENAQSYYKVINKGRDVDKVIAITAATNSNKPMDLASWHCSRV